MSGALFFPGSMYLSSMNCPSFGWGFNMEVPRCVLCCSMYGFLGDSVSMFRLLGKKMAGVLSSVPVFLHPERVVAIGDILRRGTAGAIDAGSLEVLVPAVFGYRTPHLNAREIHLITL